MEPTKKQHDYAGRLGLEVKIGKLGCTGCALKNRHLDCGPAPCLGRDGVQPAVIFVRPAEEGVNAPAAADLGQPAGRKDDGGKASWGLLMRGCSAALAGVVAVLQFGARKYAADSWQRVEGAEDRYKDALYRHLHSIETRGFLAKDPETGLLEWFHVACNALFLATFAANRAKAEAEKETH